jgi:hypothetical protein
MRTSALSRLAVEAINGLGTCAANKETTKFFQDNTHEKNSSNAYVLRADVIDRAG